MTLKEKLETIKGKKIAILVESEEQDDVLVDFLNLITHEDCIGFWGYCIRFGCNKICYSLDEFYNTETFNWGNIECYKGEYEIIKYEDFIDGIDELGFVKLTQQDINTILDEKYGKDNWVMN